MPGKGNLPGRRLPGNMKQLICRFVIIVKLKGGLGNQMFQYAAGRSLALRHGVKLKLDLKFLETSPAGKYTMRTIELFHFKVEAERANHTDLEPFTGRKNTRMRNLISRWFPAW